jgi:hypothetical protein
MKATFTQKDWDKLRTFQNSFNRQFGEQTYVGTDHACVFVEYSPELKAMLRPYPPTVHFEFELRALKCEDCPQQQPFLCVQNELKYVCDKCQKVRDDKKKKAQAQSKNQTVRVVEEKATYEAFLKSAEARH